MIPYFGRLLYSGALGLIAATSAINTLIEVDMLVLHFL